MLGLAASLAKGGASLLTYVKDNLKLYLDFKSNRSDTLKFPSEGSTSFDGNDYILVNNSSDLGFADGQAFSVALWFKTTAAGDMYLLDNRGGGSTTEGFAATLNASGTNYLGYIADGGNAATVTNTVDYNDGNWHHLTFTWDGTDTITSYIDGSSVGTATQALGEVDGTDLYIGKYSANNSNYFNGSMANLAIWSRALSLEEVNSVMNKSYSQLGSVEKTSLVSWWALDSAVFGDELWDEDASAVGSSVHSWTTFAGATMIPEGGAIKIAHSASSGFGAYVFLKDAHDLSSDLTVGATYKFSCDAKVDTGTVKITEKETNNFVEVSETSFTTKTIYFVATHATEDYIVTHEGQGSIIWLDNFSLVEIKGNVGLMTNQDSADLVYSSVLPDQSFLGTGVNSAYNFVSLDGSNDYIKNESYTAHQQDTGTISVWVKFGDISGFQYITGVGGNASTGTNRVITLSDENLRFSGYSADFDTGADVSADTWYHIVLIWNGTSVTFYLDGAPYTNTVSNLVTPTGTNFVVGAYPAGFGGKAHADFGTVAHWNKVLTSTEVNAIKTLGRHGNLLDSYSDNLTLCYFMSGLDAKTGFSDTATTIYDRSGNSNHGTTVSIASSDLASSPNAEPNGYAKGDTNRSTTTP